jgi:CheY-like chemotaxis protein
MSKSQVKILIVDDEFSLRHSLSLVFACMGHNVRCAEDGFSALQRIREVMPDILLADLNMPAMSGFELLSVVRRRFPDVYVIAASGAYSGDEVPPGIAADAFHEKASGLKPLFRMVQNGIESKQLSLQFLRKSTPIWISRGGTRGSNDEQVLVSCPECLRPFSLRFDEIGLTHQATCAHCRNAIDYAIVKPINTVC